MPDAPEKVEPNETITPMHSLVTTLLDDCTDVIEDRMSLEDFHDIVAAAAEAMIKTKQAKIVQMRQEMGMEGEGESN